MVANTRKVFNFAIEIDGVDVFLVQDVKLPEVEIGAVEHGATNYNIKTAGAVATSDAELQKVKPVVLPDTFAWEWMLLAQNTETGTGTIFYKRNVIFKELGPGGAILNAWMWIGAWVRKSAHSNFKRGNQNENTIETVTISVDRVKKVF